MRLHPSDPTQYHAGERAALPALLAVHAKMAGYPDMDSVIYRALAMRPTTKSTGNPAATQDSNVVMALFLALVDRRLAKETLQAIEPNCDAIGSGWCGIGVRDWLRAWALVDPAHTADLVERQLAAAKDENAKRLLWYGVQGVLELWNSSRDEVLMCLTRDYLNLFSPYGR